MIYSCCFILNKLNIRFYSTDAISYNILNYQSKLPIQIALMKKICFIQFRMKLLLALLLVAYASATGKYGKI